MTFSSDSISFHPIGWVRNNVREPRPQGWENVVSTLELRPEYAAGLQGLEDFSHIIVLFWLHLVAESDRTTTQLHPGERVDLPLVGSFATRSQQRPNPLGVAVVPLLGREGATLRVQGLDAVDGTPIVDLKPYLPPYDAPPDVTLPPWVWRRLKA